MHIHTNKDKLGATARPLGGRAPPSAQGVVLETRAQGPRSGALDERLTWDSEPASPGPRPGLKAELDPRAAGPLPQVYLFFPSLFLEGLFVSLRGACFFSLCLGLCPFLSPLSLSLPPYVRTSRSPHQKDASWDGTQEVVQRNKDPISPPPTPRHFP